MYYNNDNDRHNASNIPQITFTNTGAPPLVPQYSFANTGNPMSPSPPSGSPLIPGASYQLDHFPMASSTHVIPPLGLGTDTFSQSYAAVGMEESPRIQHVVKAAKMEKKRKFLRYCLVSVLGTVVLLAAVLVAAWQMDIFAGESLTDVKDNEAATTNGTTTEMPAVTSAPPAPTLSPEQLEDGIEPPPQSLTNALFFSAPLDIQVDNSEAVLQPKESDAHSNPNEQPETEAAYVFKKSKSGQLFTLYEISSSGGITERIPIGRSSDGYDWESTFPYAKPFACNEEACAVELDLSKEYVVKGKAVETSTDGKIANLLISSTFGPTRDAIDTFPQATTFELRVKSFLRDQMALPMSSHRVFYRQRTNARSQTATVTGEVRGPCDHKSRWARRAIDRFDVSSPIEFRETNPLRIFINGEYRTDIDPSQVNIANKPANDKWVICSNNFGRTSVRISTNCRNARAPKFTLSIPMLQITTSRLDQDQIVHSNANLKNLTNNQQLSALLMDTPPSTCDYPRLKRVFATNLQGFWYMHSSRVRLLDNTLENAGTESSQSTKGCPSVPKTFLNENDCVSGRSSCAPTQFASTEFQLNDTVLRQFAELSGMYVYYLTNLPIGNKPCNKNRARFRRVGTTCSSSATDLTQAAEDFLSARFAQVNTDDFVVDVSLSSNSNCKNIPAGGEILVTVNNKATCWKHVADDEYEVYDFSKWSVIHPGNDDLLQDGRPNPIAQFAKNGGVSLTFPRSHWNTNRLAQSKKHLRYLGRYRSTIDFTDLPTEVQAVEVGKYLGAVIQTASGSRNLFEACGSPGEVANDPENGHVFAMKTTYHQYYEGNYDIPFPTRSWDIYSRRNVFYALAFAAKDQLRQRMAWGLAQIFPLNGDVDLPDENENWVTYHDIFVRNAFGNYLDVLKEVTYSPMMGDMLTFVNSRSYQHEWEDRGYGRFPDENFAREIMQLFTIGLWKLNRNGTQIATGGLTNETYTNDDIMEFARAWTGFRLQPNRLNLEFTGRSQNALNYIDPMQLNGMSRDTFPKMGLDRSYIGDQYPLCRDLPKQDFLRKGAVFHYLGTISRARFQNHLNPGSWEQFQVPSDSQLFTKLCQVGGTNNECQLPSKVVLDENLVCTGAECTVSTVEVVKITLIGGQEVFYEYIRPACVEMAFVETGYGKLTVSNLNNYRRDVFNRRGYVCEDTRLFKAYLGCCGTADWDKNRIYQKKDVYLSQRVSYDEAVEKCAADNNKTLCTEVGQGNIGVNRDRYWANISCQIQAQVSEDGRINLIHQSDSYTRGYLYGQRKNDPIKFRVAWRTPEFPSLSNQCGNGLCTAEKDTCICSTTVTTRQVFTEIPTGEQALKWLHIGAHDPSIQDQGMYTNGVFQNGVTVYYDSTGQLNEKTIFKVQQTGRNSLYLLNSESVVQLGRSSDYEFRNPPQFMQINDRTSRDAAHETDAVLKHFLYNPNTAPFVADLLIKRLVTSNPSPRYVRDVANAFRKGSYQGIGKGKYGDLSATVAAILLDRECLESSVRDEPSFGKYREPLIKIFHYLRALEYKPTNNHGLVPLYDLMTTIGQDAYAFPSIFNFYQSEFQPPGPIRQAGLVAPETQIMTTPLVIGLLNGLLSLSRYGLMQCSDGFAYATTGTSCNRIRQNRDNPDKTALSVRQYQPKDNDTPEQVIDDLSILLTGGRLGESRKQMIVDLFTSTVTSVSRDRALEQSLVMFSLMPAFHTTSRSDTLSKRRASFSSSSKQFKETDYRAVVYLYLGGGWDSYNTLIPHSDCDNGKDMFQHYKDVRQGAAVDKDTLLTIDAPGQICTTFGINGKMPRVHRMYQQGEALFFANIGNLVEPITKEEYQKRTKQLPRNLFAHNIQSEQVHSSASGKKNAKGVGGRLCDEMILQGKTCNTYSVHGSTAPELVGTPGTTPPQVILGGSNGLTPYDGEKIEPQVKSLLGNLTSNITESILGETWTDIVRLSVERNDFLDTILGDVQLETTFPSGNGVYTQMQRIAEVIKVRQQLEPSIDVFSARLGGFDTHNTFTGFESQIEILDIAVKALKDELVAQGVWDKTTVVIASEFGRTMTSNGRGTDHAWGGNTFVVGGSINGGRVLGTYPSELGDGGKLNVGRGRVIPTTPWEAIWQPIGEKHGVPAEQLSTFFTKSCQF